MLDTGISFAARDAASLISWWQEMGVDSLVDEVAVPWLGRSKPVIKPVRDTQNAASSLEKAAPKTALPAELAPFLQWFMSTDSLPESGPAAQRIAPSGDASCDLMVLFDMPEVEDRHSLLSGEVGELFDRMLAKIDRDRSSIYLATLTPNRAPTGILPETSLLKLGEIAKHHIALVAPKRLWIMGGAASRAVLGIDVVEARGSLHKINHDGSIVEAVASYHPRFLLKNPRRRNDAWADMQLLTKGIDA
jgi:uracil-DNA glycosylase